MTRPQEAGRPGEAGRVEPVGGRAWGQEVREAGWVHRVARASPSRMRKSRLPDVDGDAEGRVNTAAEALARRCGP